jgi:hypothetical protein
MNPAVKIFKFTDGASEASIEQEINKWLNERVAQKKSPPVPGQIAISESQIVIIFMCLD